MHKFLKEPILIIKTAWGGKSLMVDFRPSSEGDLPNTAKEKDKKNAGALIDIRKEKHSEQ